MAPLSEDDAAELPIGACFRSLGCDGSNASTSAIGSPVPDVLYALQPDGTQLAVAQGQRLCLCPVPVVGGQASAPRTRRCAGLGAGERITAIATLGWVPDSRHRGLRCVLLGTSWGVLQLHSDRGALLLRCPVHSGAVKQIRVRLAGSGLQPGSACDEVCVVLADALARLHAEELHAWVLAGGVGEQPRQGGRGGAVVTPAVHKWLMPRGTGPRTDGVLLGLRPPTLRTVLDSRAVHKPLQVLAMTSGVGPPLASFKGQEQHSEYSPTVYALASSLASSIASGAYATLAAAGSAVLGRTGHSGSSSSQYPGSGGGGGRPGGGRGSGGGPGLGEAGGLGLEAGEQGSPPDRRQGGAGEGSGADKAPAGVPSKLYQGWMEDQRTTLSLVLSPRGPLAAAADNHGRVVVLDVVTCGVLRLWKGYRDAQLAWVEAQQPLQQQQQQRPGQGGAGLYLVVYAPRRAVLETWQVVPAGGRVAMWALPHRVAVAAAAPPPSSAAGGGGDTNGGDGGVSNGGGGGGNNGGGGGGGSAQQHCRLLSGGLCGVTGGSGGGADMAGGGGGHGGGRPGCWLLHPGSGRLWDVALLLGRRLEEQQRQWARQQQQQQQQTFLGGVVEQPGSAAAAAAAATVGT